MIQVFKEVIKSILLFTAAIFLYGALITLVFPGSDVGTGMGAILYFFRFVFTLEIFNYPRFWEALVLFGGIPPVVIMWVSRYLPNKLNFTLVPLAIVVGMALVMPTIYVTVFNIKDGDYERLARKPILDFFALTGAIFQAGVSFAIVIWRKYTRKKGTIFVR